MEDKIDDIIGELEDLRGEVESLVEERDDALNDRDDAEFNLETLKGELSWLTVKPYNKDIGIQNQMDIRDMLVNYFKENGIHYEEGAY